MKLVRYRKKIAQCLATGPKSHSEIKEYINANTCRGVTSPELSNILAWDPLFIKEGHTPIERRIGGGGRAYPVTIWSLKDNGAVSSPI